MGTERVPVGIDCEWKDPVEHCAVLQIAAGGTAWVIDTCEARHSDALYGQALLDFVAWFFASPGLARLGFGSVGVRVAAIYNAMPCGHMVRLQGLRNLTTCVSALQCRFRGDISKIGCLLHKLVGHYGGGGGGGVDHVQLAELNKRLWETSDIQVHSRDMLELKDTPSLAHVASVLLGVDLDKAEQRSDWERRPLSTTQIRYAGLDAYVLLQLYPALQRRGYE